MILKLKARRVLPYRESEGKMQPLWFDDEEKLWIELENGKIIVVPKELVVGYE